jgi:hypothetical protein
MLREYNAGKNHNIKIGNKSFGRLEQYKYLETTLKQQNSIHKTMKKNLNSGKAYPYSVQNFFASLIAILKCEDQDTQKCKFACCFV